MANTTISGLPAGAKPDGTETVPAVQAGATVRLTVAQLASLTGTPNSPVTDAAAARPTGFTVVYWTTATQPTNWVAGDIWTQA